MPEVELGERVQQEDLVEHRPGCQPRALPDLDVWQNASHNDFTATGGAGPVGLNLRLVAAQCARGCDLLSRGPRAEARSLLPARASSLISCARQAVRRTFLTR